MNDELTRVNITRREFFRIAGFAGIGLVISIYVPGCSPTPEMATTIPTQTAIPPTFVPTATRTTSPAPTSVPNMGWSPNIYATLDSKGILTIKAFRTEMGQGATTALAMILAEELDADWSTVRIDEHVGANRAYGDQLTGGSRSVSASYSPLRQAGAAARQLLVMAAAQKWSVESGTCRTEQSTVIHPDGKTRLSYGELVNAASQLDASKISSAPLKDPSTFKLIGTSRTMSQGPSIVRGEARYTMDIRVPGMLYAVVKRCPVFGGKVASFDGSKASAVPGVRRIVQIDSGVAVVAENTWAALRGADALQVAWDEGAFASASSASIREALVKAAPTVDDGDAQTFKSAYDVPFLAHHPIEPVNCTADVRADRCEVWAPSQAPQAAQQIAQQLTRLPGEAVIVHVPLVGGAFGRRASTDFIKDAIQVSQAVVAPVQVLWTRADEIQHDYYHPLSYNVVSATLNQEGVPMSLPSNRSNTARTAVATAAWRSVGEFTNAYARESFLDEVAARGKLDPLALRLKLVPATAQKVLQLAADKSGWGKPLPAGQGRGIAYWSLWNVTPTAQVVEVLVSANGTVRVLRVVCAVDCGQVINPDGLAKQIEGAVVFALTAVLKPTISIEKGRVQQRSFADTPLITIEETPPVEVYTVPGVGRPPTGIGEAGVPPLAHALVNAVFAATGIRVRHLPILSEDLRRK